jgi:hypothetical protein
METSPKVADVLRAVEGMNSSEASAVLRKALEGLETVKVDPAVFDPAAPTVIVAPEPAVAPAFAPLESQADREPTQPAAPAAPVVQAKDPDVDSAIELQRMMKRSRMIIVSAAAVVVLVIAGTTAFLMSEVSEEQPAPAAATEAPARPTHVRTRPHVPPEVTHAQPEDEPLPLPVAAPAPAAKAKPRPAMARSAAAQPSSDEQPASAPRTKTVASAKAAPAEKPAPAPAKDEAFEDEDLKQMRGMP